MTCLHIADQRSWYLLLLTTLCATLSLCVSSRSRFIPLVPESVSPIPPLNFPSCGTINPVRYCQSMDDFSLPSLDNLLFVYTVALSGIVLFSLWVDQLCHYAEWTERRLRSDKSQYFSRHTTYANANGPINPLRKRRKRTTACLFLLFMIVLMVETAYFLIAGFYTQSLLDLKVSRAVDTSAWSFGQVVAVTVFIPVIIDFLAIMICKSLVIQVPENPAFHDTAILIRLVQLVWRAAVSIGYHGHGA